MGVRKKIYKRANDISQGTGTLKGWRFEESGKFHKAAGRKSQRDSVKDEYKYCHAGLMAYLRFGNHTFVVKPISMVEQLTQ